MVIFVLPGRTPRFVVFEADHDSAKDHASLMPGGIRSKTARHFYSLVLLFDVWQAFHRRKLRFFKCVCVSFHIA